MPQDALKNLIQCMYFSDGRDDEREDCWDAFYLDKKEGPKAGTVQHQNKLGCLEDA